MEYSELHIFAVKCILRQTVPSQAELRRGISALYYGLFHHLTTFGTEIFKLGGVALQRQAARAYAHGVMRDVCERYVRSSKRPFQPPFDTLVQTDPDKRLIAVADAFVQLQAARHIADYDLAAVFTRQEAVDLLRLARLAHRDLADIPHLPETITFLTALLLADRWSRRG